MKKCPPGVICIENFTSLILFAIVFIIGYFIYVSMKNSNSQHRNSQPQNNNNRQNNGTTEIVLQPSYPYNNLNIMERNDVLLDPYDAPYKDERYLTPKLSLIPVGAVPINISTNIHKYKN